VDRAAEVAAGLGDGVAGAANERAVEGADLVVLAVPWAAHEPTLRDIEPALADGVVLVDCVNPLGFDDRGPHPLAVPEGSAAEQAQALAPRARVVAAFHHVSAVLLADADVAEVNCDVLILGDDRAATDLVIGLAEAIPGVRGIFAGRLRNAGQVEALTANLIAINRRYKAHAGIRVTDV
jgi:NADPH-dependent F420 reductase